MACHASRKPWCGWVTPRTSCSWAEGGFGTEAFGHCRCVATRTNRQPATANYLRPPGADEYTLAAVDVLRIEDGLIADVTAFYGPALKAFDLPRTLPV